MQDRHINPLLSELQKIALYDESYEAEANETKEPMNPDHAPMMQQADADAESAKTGSELDAELQAKKDDITTAKEDAQADKEAEEVFLALHDKVASALPEFGVLARLYDWAQGGQQTTDELFKEAASLLDEMLSSEEAYMEHMTKVAQDLFSSEENQDELYSADGIRFVLHKMADFMENPDLQSSGNGFLQKVQDGVGKFMGSVQELGNSVRHLDALKSELKAANTLLAKTTAEWALEKDPITGVATPRGMELLDQMEANPAPQLRKQVMQGRLGRGALFGGAAAGAIYGGHKLHSALHPQPSEEQVAGAEDKVLLNKVADGTLMEEYRSEIGGIAKMKNTTKASIVRDFLKIAGAAALIQAANDPSLDVAIVKEARDTFNEISLLGRKDMDEAFIKVAQQVYTEPELHEVVAGKYTDHLLEKVSFYVEANNMSAKELEKTAGAAGVATKGVAGALSDAASNIEEYIGTAKKEAEGAGREYIGVVKGAEGKGDNKGPAGTGTPGGGIIANNMAGYKVINNPGEYDVEQTAAMLEDAVLAKQAAYDTYYAADEFIKNYAGKVSGK